MRANLPRVWGPGEPISPGYETPVSQSPQGMIPWAQSIFFERKKSQTFFNVLVQELYSRFEWWNKLEAENLIGLPFGGKELDPCWKVFFNL